MLQELLNHKSIRVEAEQFMFGKQFYLDFDGVLIRWTDTEKQMYEAMEEDIQTFDGNINEVIAFYRGIAEGLLLAND